MKRLMTLGLSTLVVAAGADAAGPVVKVSLHPDVAAIAPGTSFDVGVEFVLPDEWHIYWKNPGGSGMAPRIDWTLPPGFELGELSFPAPKRRIDPGAIVTNILEGSPVLVQRIKAPNDLKPGVTIELAAVARWLVCKQQCVLGWMRTSVDLPVADAPAAAKPEHRVVLDRARRALPIPAAKAKYVKVSPSVQVKSIRPEQRFDVLLDVEVVRGNHIQSNQPTQPTFIPTHVFVEPAVGLKFGAATYPEPETRRHPQLGPMSEYHGRLKIRVPVEATDEMPGDAVRIAGVFTSQACNDKTGTCYPPEHVAWSVEAAVAGSAQVGDRDAEAAGPDNAVAREDSVAPDGTAAAEARPPAPKPAAPGPAGAIEIAEDAVATPAVAGSTPGDAEDRAWIERLLKRLGLPGLLFGCFLYGLFINATPCVLPLLSIKVLGFVQQAHESRGRTLLLGAAFGAGVMVFFVILGFLASRGQNVLQYPVAVIALGVIVMALALSMLGVYTLQVPTTASKLEAAIQKEGPLASLGKGALAPVLGFACTGPLLAGAFGWATQQPPNIAFVAFLVAGLGMAFPYMLLGAFPNWLSFLPKPGPWMITFERVMGFLLLGMVILLVHPLLTHMGAEGLEWTLAFLVAVATACWVLGKVNVNMPPARRWGYRGGAAALVAIAGTLVYGVVYPPEKWKGTRAYAQPDDWSAGIPWRPWSVREAVQSGRTVFLDFTSAYCTQCKANKLVATNTPEVRAKMQAMGVIPFQGDFTKPDPDIAEMLKKFERPGVPLNLIYPAGRPDDPILLPTVLSKEYLLSKLEEAGPSVGFVNSARGT